MPYQAALLVLLLTPEAYLPLRAVAAQYHASAEGGAAAEQRLRDPGDRRCPRRSGRPAPAPVPDLRSAVIRLDEVTVAYPGRDRPGPGPAQPDHQPRGADRAHRAERSREEHAAAAAAAVHRPGRGADLRRRGRPRRRPHRRLARPDRLGPAAPAAVRRVGGRQHRPRPARRRPGPRSSDAAAAGRRGRVHRVAPPRLRHAARRTRGRLSAGQRQQLALARAFLRGRPAAAARRAHRPPGPRRRRAIDGVLVRPDGRAHDHPGHPPARGRRGASQVITLDGGRLAQAPRCLPADRLRRPAAMTARPAPAGLAPGGAAPAAAAAGDGPPAARQAAGRGGGRGRRHRLRRRPARRLGVPAGPGVPAPFHSGVGVCRIDKHSLLG